MTVAELLELVCECLDEIGVTPVRAADACGEWRPDELGLDQQTIAKLIACIDQKVKAQGQTVVVGKRMWRRSRTVRDFCEALAENLE
jgi:hypothetical protein